MTVEPKPTPGTDVMLRAFRERLRETLPFREDQALIDDLLSEAEPVLEALRAGYAADRGAQAAQHEGFALLTLLCRSAAVLGATPTAALAIARALAFAFATRKTPLSDAQRDELEVVAVEGYCAGRDEERERSLRRAAAESQVCVALAPRCYAVFLAGTHHAEQLNETLDEIARQLFRAEASSLLLDLSLLRDEHEEIARAVFAFVSTQLGLGTHVVITGARETLSAWLERLDVAAQGGQLVAPFADALGRALGHAGYEVRLRRRLGHLVDRVRSGPR